MVCTPGDTSTVRRAVKFPRMSSLRSWFFEGQPSARVSSSHSLAATSSGETSPAWRRPPKPAYLFPRTSLPRRMKTVPSGIVEYGRMEADHFSGNGGASPPCLTSRMSPFTTAS